MKTRGQNLGPVNFRTGSGFRSPFLLTGLVECGRCSHRYQGRTVNSTKYRKDGSKIQTLYYACGSFIMKGASTCEKLFLRKEPLEAVVLDLVHKRLKALLTGEENAANVDDPRREIVTVRARLAEINRKADVLLEGLSAETRGFIDTKLRDLAVEQRTLEQRLSQLEALPYQTIDVEAILKHGKEALRSLPRLMESGSLEERKEFVQSLVERIVVKPDEERLDVHMKKLPATVFPQPGVLSVGVVAGAGFEPATFGL
jgi:recombinase-like zinc beta ribbon protein